MKKRNLQVVTKHNRVECFSTGKKRVFMIAYCVASDREVTSFARTATDVTINQRKFGNSIILSASSSDWKYDQELRNVPTVKA